MNEQLVVTFDSAHVRVYRRREAPLRDRPNLVLLEAAAVPAESVRTEGTFAPPNEASPAGREAGAAMQSLAGGHRQHVVTTIAEWVQRVLYEHPTAQWHCAAKADLSQDVFRRLGPDAQRRLACEIDKDLAHLSPKELEDHFQPRFT